MLELIVAQAQTKAAQKIRRRMERGLTTVEYAIGLLGAAAAAMLLLRIFSDNEFFKMLSKWVTDMFVNAAKGQ